MGERKLYCTSGGCTYLVIVEMLPQRTARYSDGAARGSHQKE
jgi:hypothetical protein